MIQFNCATMKCVMVDFAENIAVLRSMDWEKVRWATGEYNWNEARQRLLCSILINLFRHIAKCEQINNWNVYVSITVFIYLICITDGKYGPHNSFASKKQANTAPIRRIVTSRCTCTVCQNINQTLEIRCFAHSSIITTSHPMMQTCKNNNKWPGEVKNTTTSTTSETDN